jgi:hypothetical protein
MFSSILPLPLSNPLGSHPPGFDGGLWSLPLVLRGGLGTNFSFVGGPRSLILQIASCKLVGLKAFTQPFKGSINPSVKRIMSLVYDTSCTMIASLYNSSMYTSGSPVFLICVSSRKCYSGSPWSNLLMSL